MKKILLGLSAFTMLFATSCQNDQGFDTTVGETSTVTFAVETPEIATRAYSDGTTATVLQYAVYNEAGQLLADLAGTTTINTTAKVELQLTTGNEYSVIFWAAAPNAPYTVDFAAKTMEVDYTNATSNDEARDAFYKYHTFTVTGAQTETIELRRPFAQLNIGTADYAASTSAGYTPTKSAVTVKNIYKTLNLATGVVGEPAEITFSSANIPSGETFPVVGYEYMAMNYLLVPADKEVVDVVFTYTDNNNDAKERTVGSVPVQRNYRTNIYGNLLTSNVDINVEIKPEYIDSHDAVLQMAAAFGGEVTLTEDIVLEAPLKVSSNLTINLNGKTLSGAVAKGAGAVVDIAQGTTVEIVGGTIKSTNENGDAAINNAGTLVLENVTIEGAPLADGGYSAYAVISSGNLVIEEGTTVSADRGCLKFSGAGETVINGGHFTNNDIGTRTLTSHVVDVENGGTHKLTINGGTFEHLHSATSGGVVICNRTRGTVYVNGGNFSGGNYYGNDNLSDYGYGGTFAVTGGVYTANPAARYLVAGYKSVVKDGVYHVIANDTELVSSSTQFNDALSAGQNVLLASDVNIGKIDLTAVSDDVVIDGNGYSITTASSYGVEVTAGKNITLKNAEVVITVDGNYINYSAGFKISNGDYAGKTIKLENCEIRMCNTDWAYAVNMPASVKNLNLVIDGCTLEGAVAFQCWGDNNTITATNSHFICNYTTSAMYTSYCVALQGDGTNNSENNTLNINGCKFSYSGVDNFDSPIRAVYNSSNGINNTITVVDCTYDNKVIAY